MSSENDDQHSPSQPTEMNNGAQKKIRFSYNREFLLSLSDLDVCQKLPSGFDQSILSELQDVSLDRQRISGGLSANSFRRNDYGSSPPTRGDATGYSRGSHGRWDSRSSVRGDRESDSQSERDSDSGRRYGNQSKRPWQVPEHDGLLGSGSFPRPSGYAAGATASKLRPNEQYQLNKSNEPYHPPRPYKAAPFSRRETDSLNDETFGSSDCTDEDRAEEERKRRASFELMRQEQHKAFQEKQKLNIDNKDDFTTMLEEDAKEEKRLLKRGNESDGIVKLLASDNDSGKPSVPFQTPAPRPLVPPGFTSTILDKNLGAKSSNQPHAAEVGNPESEDDRLHAKSNHVSNLTSINHKKQLAEEIGLSKQQHESASRQASINSQSGNGLDILSALDVSNKKIGIDSKLYNKTNVAQTFEASKSGETAEVNVEKVTRPSILGESNKDNSGSILEKLFGSALALNGAGSSAVVEHQETKADEMSMNVGQSSKFARWFHEEERKPRNDQSSSRPNDLLSLIGGGEKDESQVFGDKNENSLANFLKNSEPADRLGTSNATTTSVGDSDQLYKNKAEVVSAVLTCEDLEQSILSEISENDSASKQQSETPVQSWTDPDGKAQQPKVKVDNHASLHLLSLLQKGTSLKDVESPPNMDSSSDNLHDIERASIGSAIHNTRETKVENISDAANNLTLETLFGTAFMKELQSVGAPVSIQRGPVGSARVDASDPHGFPSLVMGDGLFPSKSESGLNAGVHDSNVLTANKRKPTKLDGIEQQWSGFDGAQAELNASQLRTNLGSKASGFDASADVRLPEEDSLISVSDPLNLENFLSSANSVKTELQPTSSTQVDIAEKLASLNSAFRDERLMREGQEPPFLRCPYDMRGSNIPYQTHNIQPSLAQLHHSQINNMGPMFRPIDSHPANVNPQMKFMAPEAINHRDPATSRQIPINMLRPPFHHPSTGLSGFDQPPIHHPMLQQMHMAGNFPPNMPQGLPRGGPSMPHHPNRGVPMPAHPNFGTLGMPQPGPDLGGGGNHPEALQRLIEMELRANSKKIHPFASGGQSPGMYGHELDMGFGFR